MSRKERIEAKLNVPKTNKLPPQTETVRSANPAINPGVKDGGFRSVPTTNAFRLLNFELFAKPNKFVMGLGVLALSVCVGYIAYLNVTAENRKELYTTIKEDGTFDKHRRKSRWD